MEINSITAVQNRNWLDGRGCLKLHRYLRRNHHKDNWPEVFRLLYWAYPDEGRKLVENYDLPEYLKIQFLIEWIIYQPQITCLIFGDQRAGKDSLICKIFDMLIRYFKDNNYQSPRFVTLGNVRNPPFVKKEDMFFSFKKIPSGTKEKPVYIYCSEIEQVLPAREINSPENKLFSVLEGTLAQNHQKLFGAVKLSSKVDLNVIRSCNVKLFKYITPDKLEIEGVERKNIISDLAKWLLPKNVKNKKETLMVFNKNLLTANFDLPYWWSDEYSEQFKDVPIEKVWEFVDSMMFDTPKLTPSQINVLQTAVFQKFRTNITLKKIKEKYPFLF